MKKGVKNELLGAIRHLQETVDRQAAVTSPRHKSGDRRSLVQPKPPDPAISCSSLLHGVQGITIRIMKTIKVRVEGGRIVGEAPPRLLEGTELELCIADPGDGMTEEELAKLNRALETAWRSVKEGRVRPAAEVIAEIRAKR